MIKADKFLILETFVAVDRDEKELDTHVIQRRPFLTISEALIDMLEQTITLWVGGEQRTLDILEWNRRVNATPKPPRGTTLGQALQITWLQIL